MAKSFKFCNRFKLVYMEVTQLQKDPVGNKPTAVTFPLKTWWHEDIDSPASVTEGVNK